MKHIPEIQRHISQIKEHSASYLLYSQRANDIILKTIAKFTKLIKRIRYLQVWLKSSDIWRWLSGLKWERFEAFSKVEILMFFEASTKKISKLKVSELAKRAFSY
jgi:hypothetical protein